MADSHIACRACAVPLPCRAAKGLECVFPIWFTKCGRFWFTLAMPRPYHPRPCRSSQGYSTACRRETACCVSASVRLLPAITRSSTKIAIRRKPISDAGGQCETKYRLLWTRKRVVAAQDKKDDLLHCWTSRSDTSGYHANFHEGHCTVGAGQGCGMACVN